MENYTIINNNLITSLSISDGAYRCYNLLLSMCYGKTFCYPSIAYIATALGRSCRTVNRYIKELCKLNLIVKRRRGSISNLYVLLQKKTQQTVEKVKDVVDKARKAYNERKHDTKQHVKKESNFTDYEQRHYDWNKLEGMLLGKTKGNYEDCLLE